jgi:hypothetical protein
MISPVIELFQVWGGGPRPERTWRMKTAIHKTDFLGGPFHNRFLGRPLSQKGHASPIYFIRRGPPRVSVFCVSDAAAWQRRVT